MLALKSLNVKLKPFILTEEFLIVMLILPDSKCLKKAFFE